MLSMLENAPNLEKHWVQSVIQVVGIGVLLVVDKLKSFDSWTYVVVYLSHLVICVL